MSHYYYNSEDGTYYYKSEKTSIKDLSDYIIYKYDQIYRYKNYTGSFTGSFYHTSEDSNDNLYGNFTGTASGYFNGYGNLYNTSLTSSIVTYSSIDENTVLSGSHALNAKGTFTGSYYDAVEGLWIDKIGLNDSVTFYGKSLYSVTSSHAIESEKSKYAEVAGYVNVSYADRADRANDADHAQTADTVSNASRSEYSNVSAFATSSLTSSYSDYAVRALNSENAVNAIYAKYAENMGEVDAYPVGYSEYVKITSGNGTNVCEDSEYDGTNFKWIKFKCKSTGIYTLTYDYTALRLSKMGSVGQVIGDPLTKSNIYYGLGYGNWASQAIYLTVHKMDGDSKQKDSNSISAANTYNTVIQFESGLSKDGGSTSDQYCPETVQCRNIVYDIKLLKDISYIVVVNYYPFRKDCIINDTNDPCYGEYFCGVYYKVSPLSLMRFDLAYNTASEEHKDHSIENNLSGYVNPVLEIRKVKNWDGNS